MKKRILGIFVCMLMMVATSGMAAQSILSSKQNQRISSEPLITEPLPVTRVKEIPLPWQYWEEFPQEGVLGIIVLPKNVTAVAIVRAYAVLYEEVPLEDLLWDNTMGMDIHQIDDSSEPYILEPGGQVEYFIPTIPWHKAVIMRYSVALAQTPNVIIGHFVNEILLESWSSLSNFDINNDYSKPINNFDLELYGVINPADVMKWYDDTLGLDPTLKSTSFGLCWYDGWGVPPTINSQAYGIEIIWLDKAHPVTTGEWVHFGVTLRPGVTITGARAYWTITTSIDSKGNDNISYHSLFLQFLEQHQHLFPILQKIRDRLGQ